MKTIFSKVKLRPGQIVQFVFACIAVGSRQMLLPSFLAQMISMAWRKEKTVLSGCMP